jgi:hypothetical protein
MQREDNQNKTHQKKYSTIPHYCTAYSPAVNGEEILSFLHPLTQPLSKEKILTGSILQELPERRRRRRKTVSENKNKNKLDFQKESENGWLV